MQKMEENPWALPPLPEDYDQCKPPRHYNALLNLTVACCILFLSVVFPLLMYQKLSGSHSLFGWQVLVVTSDSMEPTIVPGALIFAEEVPFAQLQTGDIIVFTGADGLRYTHRVVALEFGALRTQGDNEALPDAQLVAPEQVECRVAKIRNGFARISRGFLSANADILPARHCRRAGECAIASPGS